MIHFMRNLTGAFIIIVILGFMLTNGYAQKTQFGVRVGLYTDVEDAFIGAEVNTPIATQIFFNPNFEYVFIEGGNYITLNADFHYDVNVNGPLYLWLGGGPALIFIDPDGPADGDTDFGINLIGGIGLQTNNRIVPYFQPKIILSDDTEVSLAFGIRF